MKKISGKVVLKTIGAMSLTALLTVGVTIPFSLADKIQYSNSSDYNFNEAKFKNNESTLSVMLAKNSLKELSSSTVKRSLKMVLKLYRGGYFDFSKTQILNSQKKVEYQDFINFIDGATSVQLTDLARDFNKIAFKKKFSIKFVQYLTISNLLKNRNLTSSDVAKIKDLIIKDAFDHIYDDFSFFTMSDRKQEVSIKDVLPIDAFKKFVTFIDKNDSEFSYDDTLNAIHAISTQTDLLSFFADGPQEPIFTLNLSNKYLVNFSSIKDNSQKPIYNQNSSIAGFQDVRVNYDDYDPIFGYKKSLYEYKPFIENHNLNNVISPMLTEEIWTINPNAKWDWGFQTRYYDHIFSFVDKDEEQNSIEYTKLKTLEDVLDYDGISVKKQILPLNRQRFFENKLKDSQTPEHGVTAMSAPDSFKEHGTKFWYPHYKSTYQTMWQYMKNMVYWGYGLTMPTPDDVSTAHKNGVRAFGTLFNDEPSSMTARIMSMTEKDKSVFVENLIKIVKDSGVDGVFWNAEIAGWSTSGITYPAFYKFREFMQVLDQRFKQEGIEFFHYMNNFTEAPRDFSEQRPFLDFITQRFINKNYVTNDFMDSSSDSIINMLGVPSDGLFHMNHFKPNLELYDNEFGVGADKQLFLGFVDKADSTQHDLKQALIKRLAFANAHKDYTLQILQYDFEPQTRDFISSEWKMMQDLKTQNLPELNGVDLDHYYGDLAMFANADHMSPEFEWDIPRYISRGSIDLRKIDNIADDFHDYRGNNPSLGEAGGRGQWNSAPYQEWYWKNLDGNPRTKSGALSDYFQERSTIGSDSNFSTSFEFGYGHFFNENGIKVISGDWANIGAQDMLPTYRYIIDAFDAQGNKNSNIVGAHIVEDVDSIYGSNILGYSGKLKANESIVNKLYVSNIDTNKEFSIIVKDVNAETSLALWRNKLDTPEFVKPKSIQNLSNGYKKLSFDIQATQTNNITSFGIKVKNISTSDFELANVKVDGISFNGGSVKQHKFDNLKATTLNKDTNGINVTFEDVSFDENTRYFIYDENDHLVTFAASPSFHIEKSGRYKIKVKDSLGNEIGFEKNINVIALNGWQNA